MSALTGNGGYQMTRCALILKRRHAMTALYTCPDHPQAKVRKETEYVYHGQRGKLKRPKVVSERYFCYECGRELGGQDANNDK